MPDRATAVGKLLYDTRSRVLVEKYLGYPGDLGQP